MTEINYQRNLKSILKLQKKKVHTNRDRKNTPAISIDTPPNLAAQSPAGKAFSINTRTANEATQKRFITPTAKSNNILSLIHI